MIDGGVHHFLGWAMDHCTTAPVVLKDNGIVKTLNDGPLEENSFVLAWGGGGGENHANNVNLAGQNALDIMNNANKQPLPQSDSNTPQSDEEQVMQPVIQAVMDHLMEQLHEEGSESDPEEKEEDSEEEADRKKFEEECMANLEQVRRDEEDDSTSSNGSSSSSSSNSSSSSSNEGTNVNEDDSD